MIDLDDSCLWTRTRTWTLILTCMILICTEFLLAVLTATLMCISMFRGRSGCRSKSQQETVIYPENLQYTVSTTNGRTLTSSLNTPDSISQHVQSAQANEEGSTSRPSFGKMNVHNVSQGSQVLYQK